jgi:two-component system sensor kinase FixL
VTDAAFRDMDGTINWNIASGLPLVEADHHSLLQVFLNLARNSHDAMKNTQQRMLFVEAGLESDMVVVRFRDTGHGDVRAAGLRRSAENARNRYSHRDGRKTS